MAPDTQPRAADAAAGPPGIALHEAVAWFAAYLAVGYLVIALQPESGPSFWYPPVSLGMALVLLRGWRTFPIILLADFIITISQHNSSPAAALVVGGCTTLECLAALAGARLFKARLALGTPADVLRLDLFVVALPALVGAAVGSFVVWFANLEAMSSYSSYLFTWWLGDTATTMCLLPMWLLLFAPAAHGQPAGLVTQGKSRRAEKVLLLVVGMALAWLVYASPDNAAAIANLGGRRYLCFLPVAWAAARFNTRYMAVLIAVISFSAAFASLQWMPHIGHIGGGQPPAVLDAQYFMLALATGGMLISTALEAERRLRASQEQIARQLSQRDRDLSESEERYRTLVEHAPDAIVVYDVDANCVVETNEKAVQLFRVSREQLIGAGPEQFRPRAEPDAVQSEALVSELSRRVLAGENVHRDWMVQLPDGHDLPCEVWAVRLPSSTRRLMRVSFAPISERQNADEERNRFFMLTLEMFCIIGADGCFKRLNPAWQRVLGYPDTELLSRPVLDFVHEEDRVTTRGVFQRIAGGHAIEGFETRLRARDGSYRWLMWNATPMIDGRMFYATARDMTERKRGEQLLHRNAFHDPLTGLANRAMLLVRLEHAIATAMRHKNAAFAVLFMDLDRFKLLNDTLGHMAGDQLLTGFAGRLSKIIRPTDTLARQGGDEFILLLEKINSRAEVLVVAERIQAELARPFSIQDQEIYTSTSIGIALSEHGYEQAEEAIRDADIALYAAKEQGRGCYRVFEASMQDRAMRQVEMERDLRHALAHNEFELGYLPVVSLATGELRAFEALLRWNHAQHGVLHAGDFVRTAEETGLIAPIGWWALNEACRQRSDWAATRPGPAPCLSVNISSRQLAQNDIVARVAALLAHHGVPPDQLTLEITESSIMTAPADAAEMLSPLRKLGVRIALDDFGLGYSSLNYLHRLPITTIKIDKSFVSRVGQSPDADSIVRTLVLLARELGRELIAEGVETVQTARTLRDMGCELAQGFAFSNALAGAPAGELIGQAAPWAGTLNRLAGAARNT